MKRSEAITQHREAIAKEMIEDYRIVLNASGRIEYKIYIWDDGEIEYMQVPQGDTGYLVPRDAETRDLFFVTTVASPYFDPWDVADHAAPDDKDVREAERKEIIDYMVDEYTSNLSDLIDQIIEGAEQDEKYELYN